MRGNERRLAVFASGSGSNFEAIVRACADGRIRNARVVALVCDKPGAYAVERARKLGVEALVLRPADFPSKADYERHIVRELQARGVELVCLAGYMRIVTGVLMEAFPRRIINIHPALLPSFKGAHAIRDAFEYGVKCFGVTVHYVAEEVDGGEIIDQTALKYTKPYTPENMAELESRIHAAEHKLYVAAINKVLRKLKSKKI